MKLVIVESPAKCGKIESFLGPGYKCIASFGHIRQIANGLKSIDFDNNYNVTFKTSPNKNKYIANLRKSISKADEIILATDDDREGEAIAWHICKLFKLSLTSTKRIIFREITKTAVKNAIQNPTFVDMDKVNSQMARQVLDLLVGYTISPLLWKYISRNSKSSLSAGRCQTPALRLVYEQQKLIEESPGKKVYSTKADFTKKNLVFELNYSHKDEDSMGEFLEESVNFTHKYSVSEPKQVTKQPPKPFTTSTLQQKASNECHFSPKQTMKLAQTLYENGYITYMRTDSQKYSQEFIFSAKKFIDKNYGEDYINSKIHCLINGEKETKKEKSKKGKKKNNAQEAHEAIRPTKVEKTILVVGGKITAREIKLYNLIWKNTVESCMSPSTYYSITASISAPENHKYKFTSEQVIFPGWKIVEGYDETNKIYHYLLKIKNDKTMNYKEINSKVTLKDLKKNFTEARLVQMLEKKGIGRPSTFSNLISKIQEREYVKKQDVPGKKVHCIDFKLTEQELEEIETDRVFGNEKNKLVIQPIGIIVYEFLAKHFDGLFNYDYTKDMEDSLDLISKGEKIWHSLCDECNTEMKESCKSLESQKRITYKIDDYHTYMIGKHGPVIKYEKDGETSFKSVNRDIDMNKLQNGELSLNELLDNTAKKPSGKILGEFNGENIILKSGKYGMYISFNGKNSSVKHVGKDYDDVTLEDVLDVVKGKKQSNKSIIKEINDEISIRKGKYGPYVFYKTKNMKRPKFINMKGMSNSEITVDWVMNKI